MLKCAVDEGNEIRGRNSIDDQISVLNDRN